MKMRNKGKIHPLISSSSSTQTNNDVVYPVLNLLPTVIFTLISLLSIQEREVLAYMVSRSLKPTNPLTTNNKKNKKQSNQTHDHKSPALFECDCFHCYTSFWFQWDSSPNRELIHQAIEAFEEHLNSGEQQYSRKSTGNSKSKKKEKMGRRKSDKNVVVEAAVDSPEKDECPVNVMAESGGGEVDEEAAEVVAAPVVAVEGHRGLARKVLPDVMGIFNSRLWRLWSPNA